IHFAELRPTDRRGDSMKFGIFYEHQLPRPWASDDEHRLLKDALDQVELADRLGIDYAWEVEHHFLEEYSHSSAPEVFLAAASQRRPEADAEAAPAAVGRVQPPRDHPPRRPEGHRRALVLLHRAG